MTANQIAYQRLQEEKRHNLVVEEQTSKRDDAQARYWTSNIQLGYDQLAETMANNRMVNDTKLQQLAEDTRHHLVSEDQTWYQLDIQQGNLNELIRSNQAREGENFRHNVFMETETQIDNAFYRDLEDRKQTYFEESDRDKRAQGWANISIARQNAETNAGQLELVNRQQVFYESQFIDAYKGDLYLGKMKNTDFAQAAFKYDELGVTRDQWERSHPWAQTDWGGVVKDVLPIAAGVATAVFTKGKVKVK